MYHSLGMEPLENETLVYVCLNCGRRSCDRSGIMGLTPGWSASCSKEAVQLPSDALKPNGRGLVVAISRKALLRSRVASFN